MGYLQGCRLLENKQTKKTQQLIHDDTSIVPPSGNQQHKAETLNLTAAATYNMFYVTDEVFFGHLKISGTESSLNSRLFLSPYKERLFWL